ncbi:MAG: substrate-binding domain-containing protein, partial [Firmicutes bacterium]|nr:substrate-binding domain-containing protein [Bacillota bacterium]
MKKLVRIFAVVLCLGFAIGAFAACGADFDAERPIVVTTRATGSGTKAYFVGDYLGLTTGEKDANGANILKADPGGVLEKDSTAALAAAIKSNPQSIGYESLGYVNTNDVKMLTVDGKECTTANIKNSTYPISRPLSVLYKEDHVDSSNLFKYFLAFLSSKEANTLINEGYVTISDTYPDYAHKSASLNGTIKVSGSTSLQPLMDKLAEKFKSFHSGVTVQVTGGGSSTGVNNAKN